MLEQERRVWRGGGGHCMDALEGKGPQRRPQRRPQKPLDRRFEEVAKAVGGGYCRLQMPLKLALAVRETVAGHRLGAPGGGGGVGCSVFLHTHSGSIASPHQAKARDDARCWEVVGWDGEVG